MSRELNKSLSLDSEGITAAGCTCVPPCACSTDENNFSNYSKLMQTYQSITTTLWKTT